MDRQPKENTLPTFPTGSRPDRVNIPDFSSICCVPSERSKMIRLTRLNHIPLIVNSDLIEHIEVTPDTVVTLMSGQKFMVLESSDEVVERVIAFRKSIFGK